MTVRLLTLELKAFGPFTDAVIDFSGDAGLHLVYGPNEAGKSSALRAITSLFYGIPRLSPDVFVHDATKLRIGGRIRHSDGSELAFLRRKGNKNTLLDPEERALDDFVLHKYLSGVSREMFSIMFGIDHDRLREGGRQLIAGEGDLAEGLYAAALGASGLRDMMKSLREEADRLFKPAGSVPLINKLIAQHKDSKKECSELSLPGREWVQRNAALKQAETDRRTIMGSLGRLGSELNRLQRIEKAVPVIVERKSLLNELASLGETRLLSVDFGKERRLAAQKLETARSAVTKASRELDQIARDIKALQVPEDLLSQKGLIKELHQRLGSHRKALSDKPRLQANMEQLRQDALLLLRELSPELGMKDAETFRMPEARKIRIQNLGGRYRSLVAVLERAREEAKKIEASLASDEDALKKLETSRDPAGLNKAIRAAQAGGDLEKQLSSTAVRIEEEKLRAEKALRSLPLWTRSLAELENASFPLPETIERFEQDFRDLEGDLKKSGERRREAADKKDELGRGMVDLQRGGAVPTEEDLDAARSRRDAGWRLVRRAWLEGVDDPEAAKEFDSRDELPEAYEKSVRKADEAGDRLRREADRAARMAQLRAAQEECSRKIAEANGRREKLAADQEKMQAEWAGLWGDLGSAPLSPREMRGWLGKRDKLIEQAAALKTLESETTRLKGGIAVERARVGERLVQLSEPGAGEDETLRDLIERADEVKKRIEAASKRRENLEEKIGDLRKRRDGTAEEIREAGRKLAEWRKAWGECMGELRLGADAGPEEANAVVSRIQEMLAKTDEAGKLALRINGIGQDADAFAADAGGLMERVAPDLAELPVEQAVGELNNRLDKAVKDAATLQQLEERRREKLDAIREARAGMDEAERKFTELCRQAGRDDAKELEEAENQSERLRFLRNGVERLDGQLAALSGGAGVEDFVKEAEEIDADAIPGKIAETGLQIKECEENRSALDQEIGGERTRLAAMDGSAKALEAAEKAESVLAQLRDAVERYARLHMASVILEKEIERYREANQGPILTLASEIFSMLTLGSFAALKPVYEKGDKPVLAGFRPSGQSVSVEGMSEGTLDQLYLSLRLASLQKQTGEGETMPFILDDILINFDDERSKATLGALARISTRTQMIFFTHHVHLTELAKAAVPDGLLHIHDL